MKENLKEKVKVKDILNNKLLKKGALTGLIVLAILIIFVVINRSIYFLNLAPADFTDDKIYSLTDKSKDLIKEIEQNVNVYVFGYSENSTVGILAKQYHDLNNKINVQFVSTNSRVDLAQEYNVSTADSLIAIESSQRYKAIDKSELYTYDAVDKTYYDLTEQKITNAILEVTYPEPSNVYFLTGHGEYSISDENEFLTLAKAIVNNVNDVYELNLYTSNIPEDCDLIVVGSPTSDILDLEAEKLITYIHNGGNILWIQDPYISSNVTSHVNIDRVLAEYGMSFSGGLVLEGTEGYYVTGLPDIITPRLVYNSIVKDLYRDGNVILLDSGKIDINSEKLSELNVKTEDFIKTTKGAYYKESFNGTFEKEENDLSGEFTLGEIFIKSVDNNKQSKLVAIAGGTFISSETIYIGENQMVPVELRNNKELLLNTVTYLTGRNNNLRIRKDTGVVGFDSVDEGTKTTVKVIIFAMPAIIIILGIIVTVIKRKRR